VLLKADFIKKFVPPVGLEPTTKRGPLVLEVNSSSGIQSIDQVLGVNIAEQMIIFCESQIGIKN